MDLHVLDNGWPEMLQQIQQELPDTEFVFTTNYPDPQRELDVRKYDQACAFLQQPFTRANIEQALNTLAENAQATQQKSASPKVRIPVRMKITLPYIILALVFAMGAAYVVNRVVLDSIEEGGKTDQRLDGTGGRSSARNAAFVGVYAGCARSRNRGRC
jgi:adenylate cyclase